MSFLGETNATAAHAEGSLNTFNNNNNNNNHQQPFEPTSNRQLDAQNQDPQRSPTTTQPSLSNRSPLQAVIAMASHTSLQQMSIWTPFALLRHRSRPNDNSTSINRAPDTAATQNPSKHMHSWTNPMAGMDLIASVRPKNSIMKVRRLQDSIDSKYPGGSGQATKQEAELQVVQHAKMSTADRFSRLCNPSYLFKLGCGTSVFVMCLVQYSMLDLRTRIFLTWFALVGTVFVWVILSPVAKIRALRRIVEESKQFERQWPERRRLRMPHFFVDLKNKPLFQGPKKNRWGAWKRDDPDNDSTRDSYLLFRDGRRNIRIVKRAAVLKVATEYKALNFVEKVGVKLIPLFSDECNANAYLKDPGDMVNKNRVDEYQELLMRYWWRHTFTQRVLPGLNHHYRTLTFNWESIAAQAVAAKLEAELANAPPPRKFKKVNMDKWMRDDWRWEDGLAPYIEEVSIQGRERDLDSRGAMVTTNDGSDGNNTVQDIITNDDDTTANDTLISLIDSDDIVPDSVSNVVTTETTNGDDDTTSTNEDDDSVQHSDKIPSVDGDENVDYAVSMNELVPSTTINGTFQDSIDEGITTHEDATDTNEEFSSADSSHIDDDSTTTNDLSSCIDSDDTVRVSGSDSSSNETTNEDDDCMTTNDLSSHIDSDDTVQVSGSNLSTNETTNEDDDSTTTDEDDRNVQHSDNNFFDHDEDSTTTQNELSPIDCDAATNIVITVSTTTVNETPSIGASSNTSRRRVPRPRRRTTIKSTEMEVDEATVWVNGRRRSSRLQPKTGDGFNPSNESLTSRACGETPSTIPWTNLESRDPPLDVLGSFLVKIFKFKYSYTTTSYDNLLHIYTTTPSPLNAE
ncbi:hypothetical protein IV203_000236 [Nitzschia inconspicua]|uniref:Uncharacterized protein n=1 Tax=Nitzschia inconspicua TaxID=303405 RepID=A0A9K3L4K6_9STRA|nr:hypothetical protein IV203_000236 [Nitzschia inconspicua]